MASLGPVARHSASGIRRMMNRSTVVAKGDFYEYAGGSQTLAGTAPRFK